MPNVMDANKKALANEQAFEKAGFRGEQVGKSRVYERKLSNEILDATRALITGNGHVNGNSHLDTMPEPVEEEKTVP